MDPHKNPPLWHIFTLLWPIITYAWNHNGPIERTTPIEHASVLTIVCYVSDLHRHSAVSNAWLHTPVYGSPFNLSPVNLWIFPIASYVQIVLKFGLLSDSFLNLWHWLNICKWIHNSSPPDLSDWIPYHAPLIPWFWTFSWLCASNVCTPFRRSYAFYAKIYNICSYQYHRKIMPVCGFHWHSRYSIWISTFVLLHCMWFPGSSCVHELLYLIICHDNWFTASRLAWMPNVHCILG